MSNELQTRQTEADEALSGPTDAVRPWTIKSVATETRDLAIIAARKEGLTVGQWLERHVRQWAEPVAETPMLNGFAELSAPVSPELTAAGAVALIIRMQDIPGLPESISKLAYRVLEDRLRLARTPRRRKV